MIAHPLRIALLSLVFASAGPAQGIYAKAIEKAQKVADQESYGGQVSFPDGIARFLDASLNEAAALPPPAFAVSSGFTKLAEPLRAAGKGASADALTALLNQVLAQSVPLAAQTVRGAAGAVALDDIPSLRSGRNALVDTLRKGAEARIKEQLRPLVHQAAESVGLPAAFDAFVGATGAKLPDPRAALAALEDQATAQALDVVFGYLAKQERILRNDPSRTDDKFVTAAFNMLR